MKNDPQRATLASTWLVGIIFAALLQLCGYGKASPFQVQPQSGLERAQGILNDDTSGAPLRSEGAMYDEIVAEVGQTNPQKATILEDRFANLKRSPQNLQTEARATFYLVGRVAPYSTAGNKADEEP
jgi:hypothetical protein